MIITLDKNDKRYTVKKYNPERETLFRIDGLTLEEATDTIGDEQWNI